jgi:hypothetical protein
VVRSTSHAVRLMEGRHDRAAQPSSWQACAVRLTTHLLTLPFTGHLPFRRARIPRLPTFHLPPVLPALFACRAHPITPSMSETHAAPNWFSLHLPGPPASALAQTTTENTQRRTPRVCPLERTAAYHTSRSAILSGYNNDDNDGVAFAPIREPDDDGSGHHATSPRPSYSDETTTITATMI